MSIASFGSILATWTYLPTDGPDYIKGHSINLGCGFSAAVVSVIGIVYIRNENKKRNAGDRDHRLEGLSDEERRGLGYRHPEFRYME